MRPERGNGGSSVSIDPASVPETEIAGYGHEQLVNAAYVMQAGKDLGLNARDQTIGVRTAMGESSLRNIDYGDWETGGVTNPDAPARRRSACSSSRTDGAPARSGWTPTSRRRSSSTR